MGGCIVPPRLEQVNDGGENRAPRIISESTTPPPGELDIEQTAAGSTPLVISPFTIAIDEPDKQPLTLRVFLNRKYSKVVPISSDKTTGGEVLQSKRFNISGLCDHLVDSVLGSHLLELYVSDSGFVDTGTDLREVNAGGMRTNAIWELKCNPPGSQLDGGV